MKTDCNNFLCSQMRMARLRTRQLLCSLWKPFQGHGEPTVGQNGSRLLGGHSFRVTGAQRLAAARVEIIKMMVLARWSSEVVLRYVKDAPLIGLSDQVKTLEDKQDLARLLAKAADDAELLASKITPTLRPSSKTWLWRSRLG